MPALVRSHRRRQSAARPLRPTTTSHTAQKQRAYSPSERIGLKSNKYPSPFALGYRSHWAGAGVRSMSVRSDVPPASANEAHKVPHLREDESADFVLIAEAKPPPRIELGRERMLICRLYLGLLQTITDDYGTEFAA